jgi:DNA-binding NtrC family response regulator
VSGERQVKTLRILALTADLMFSTNIESTLRRAGHDVGTIDDLTSLERELATGATDLVVLDLHSGLQPDAVVRISAGEVDHPHEPGVHGRVPVLAFGRHTEPQLLRAAREAGCVESVPRSTFVEEMTALVERAARSR